MTNSFNTPALLHHLLCIKSQPFRDQELDCYVDVSKSVASVEEGIAAGLNGLPHVDLLYPVSKNAYRGHAILTGDLTVGFQEVPQA